MKDVTGRESLTHRIGDMIERIGERIQRTGSVKLGRRVYEFGNRLEHRDARVTGKTIK